MEPMQPDAIREKETLGWTCLLVIISVVGLMAVAGWYVFMPREADPATIADIARLPLPEDIAVVQSSAQSFPFQSVYAHLWMSKRQFAAFRGEIDFSFSRDSEVLQATRGQMGWHDGERPEWWRPESLEDPLAAWSSRPARPPGEDWSRWVAILAEQHADGRVEIYLFASQDP